MPAFLIEAQDSPTYQALSYPDKVDFATLSAAINGTGIVSGGVVAPLATPGYAVQVTAPSVQIAGVAGSTQAATSMAPAAASTTDRRDIIVAIPTTVTTAWAASNTYAAASSIAVDGTVYTTTAGGTSGATAPAWPRANGATVTDGTVTWTATAGLLFVTGTPTAETSVPWTTASTHTPPVKPPIPSGACFIGEVYIPGGGGNIVAANLGSTAQPVVGGGPLTTSGLLNIAGGQAETVTSHGGSTYTVLPTDVTLRASGFGVTTVATLPSPSSVPVGQSYTFICGPYSGWAVQTVRGGIGTPATITVGAGQCLEVTNDGGGWYVTAGTSFPYGTGTNPNLSAVPIAITPGTPVQPDNASDTMLYLPVITGATLTITLGPTSSGTGLTFCTSLAIPSGSLLTFRIPIAWYFLVTTVSGSPVFGNANLVTC